ncbi:TetR/AcrR family transcriptional regulator [Solihabitans fulvus]|uniref:TetR/AcrR family transcriptional regulator n=1 Tax=Solihabitans fulvus TaxID=1892852 RepID=A0A5B2WUB2_9PSEU|nr:TetR/AcrR family transcriptional regulator [Solihabitans fulvus]
MVEKWTDPVASSIWLATPKPAGQQHPGLSRELIVRTAIEVLDANGLAALSMRKLAAQLDAAPMSLYWHVPTKSALLELAMDSALGEIGPPADGEWTDQVRALSREFLDVTRRHTWLSHLLGRYPNFGPNALTYSDNLLAVLRKGLPDDVIGGALGLLFSFMLGVAAGESQWAEDNRGHEPGLAELAETWRPRIAEMVADYPNVAKHVADTEGSGNDDTFEFGIDRILLGLAVEK